MASPRSKDPDSLDESAVCVSCGWWIPIDQYPKCDLCLNAEDTTPDAEEA